MTNYAFGEWLQKELEKREWSQTDLSRRSGVSTSQITRLIKGERGVRDETLYALATALHLPPEKVFLIAVGKESDAKGDPWVNETSYKIKLIPPGLRSVAGKFIDSLIEGEETTKPKTKPAKRGI